MSRPRDVEEENAHIVVGFCHVTLLVGGTLWTLALIFGGFPVWTLLAPAVVLGVGVGLVRRRERARRSAVLIFSSSCAIAAGVIYIVNVYRATAGSTDFHLGWAWVLLATGSLGAFALTWDPVIRLDWRGRTNAGTDTEGSRSPAVIVVSLLMFGGGMLLAVASVAIILDAVSSSASGNNPGDGRNLPFILLGFLTPSAVVVVSAIGLLWRQTGAWRIARFVIPFCGGVIVASLMSEGYGPVGSLTILFIGGLVVVHGLDTRRALLHFGIDPAPPQPEPDQHSRLSVEHSRLSVSDPNPHGIDDPAAMTAVEAARQDLRALAALEVILGGGLLAAAAGARLGLHDLFHVTGGGSPLPWQTAVVLGFVSLLVVGAGLWRWSTAHLSNSRWIAITACGVLGFGEICLLMALISTHRQDQIPWFGPTAVTATLLLIAGVAGWTLRPATRWVQVVVVALPVPVVLLMTAAAVINPAFWYGQEYIPLFLVLVAIAVVVPLLQVLQFLVRPATAGLFRAPRTVPDDVLDSDALGRLLASRSRRRYARGTRTLATAVLVCWAVLGITSLGVLKTWNRAKQRQTMTLLRTVTKAIGTYAEDHSVYPFATNMEELARILEPDYLEHVPRTDGWGWPLDYHCLDDGLHYVLRSPGDDGLFETADPLEYPDFEFLGSDWHGDIVHSDGVFSRWPDWGMEP